MKLEDYVGSPMEEKNQHEAYNSSFLHMRPAPEYATGEVVLASTYRGVGFARNVISEGKVPAIGRKFQKKINKGTRTSEVNDDEVIDVESWKRVVTGTLRSPKQPNQSSKRFLQISPVVPDASLYSLSARLSSNSWNPGALVARMIQFGESGHVDSQARWDQLFHSLSVNENDDIWARYLQLEFESWRLEGMEDAWKEPREIEPDKIAEEWNRFRTRIPANRFTEDLSSIISLKNYLTRRQWISMLESILRIGAASHVLWVCNVNAECFDLLKNALKGNPVPALEDLQNRLGIGEGYWRYGQYASTTINHSATSFLKARLGINLLLHQVESDLEITLNKECLGNVKQVHELITQFAEYGATKKFRFDRFLNNYQEILESYPRVVAGKQGIASNVKEFLRHVLGQRQTAESGLDSYDQGYFLAKKGSYKAARWIVSLGPVSVLALVHACTHKSFGPRTIQNLCHHLGEYGIDIQAQEVTHSTLGQTLRNLGLVLDSPDAEGGMVLVNPFENLAQQGGN